MAHLDLVQEWAVGAGVISDSLKQNIYAALTDPTKTNNNILNLLLVSGFNNLDSGAQNVVKINLEAKARARRYDSAISSSMSSGGLNYNPAGYIHTDSGYSYNSGGDQLLLRPSRLAVELGLSPTVLEEAILSAYQADSDNYRRPNYFSPSGLSSLVSALQPSVSGLDEEGLKGYIKL